MRNYLQLRVGLINCWIVFLNCPLDQFSDELIVISQIENFTVRRIIRKVWLMVHYYSAIVWALLKNSITRYSYVQDRNSGSFFNVQLSRIDLPDFLYLIFSTRTFQEFEPVYGQTVFIRF